MGVHEQLNTAKLFTSGGSQAVRLPKAFRFEGKEVRIRKDGNRVILEPIVHHDTPRTEAEWAVFWARLDALSDEPFPEPPPQDIAKLVDPW